MNDVENEQQDQISQMTRMTTVFERENKQNMGEYEEKYEEVTKSTPH